MITLVDYGAGNLHSVANALKRLRAAFRIVDDAEGMDGATKVIFPGVGAAGSCMRELQKRGLVEPLRSQRVPVLGICLGMQVLTRSSTEGDTEVACLDVVPGYTARFEQNVKLPQIGWNTVRFSRDDPLLTGIADGEHFYFLHSYRVYTEPSFVLGSTEYGIEYPSIVRRDNYWGVQFHPEKSGPVGLRLLQNFIERC